MERTQVEWAVEGVVTPEMESIAAAEGLSADVICKRMAEGHIVVPLNKNKKC